MRKMTLLEMTQNILSAMNSDDVNSITDTEESQMVAEEIRTTFFDLYSNRHIPELQGLVSLETVGDAAAPNRLRVPASVGNILWIKYYDYRSNSFRDLHYLEPEEFIERRIDNILHTTGTFVDVPLVNSSSLLYSVAANQAPYYYTVFDGDDTLVFDGYDAMYESWLTADKAIAWGLLNADFQMADEFIPAIDANLFPHLLSEAKSACFINIKEVANSKEEQRARRQLVRSQTRLTKGRDHRQGVFRADYSRKR